MPDGQQLDNDDLTENDLQNSGLDHAVSTTGQHVVLVTSYSPSETGTYTLEINGAADSNPTASPTTGETASANHINGELETTDPRRSTGEFYDEHHLSWTAGERVNLRLTSNSFDTYLIVRPPEGEALENDDAQPGQTDAALSFVAPVTGRYTVIASSYRAGMQGAIRSTQMNLPPRLRILLHGQHPPTPPRMSLPLPSRTQSN